MRNVAIRGAGSASDEAVGAAQVDGHAHEQELGAVSLQAAVADPAIAIRSFHQTEQALDLTADRGERDVHPLLPGGLAKARVPSVHQRIGDPGFGEGLATRLAVVGLVGIDRRLVAPDERIGDEAVADVGAGEDGAANQIGAVVDSDVRLVAEEAPLPAPGSRAATSPSSLGGRFTSASIRLASGRKNASIKLA